MAQRIDGKIDIQFRPVEVMRTRHLDGGELLDGRLLEPGEVGERGKKLAVPDEDPEAVLGDVW